MCTAPFWCVCALHLPPHDDPCCLHLHLENLSCRIGYTFHEPMDDFQDQLRWGDDWLTINYICNWRTLTRCHQAIITRWLPQTSASRPAQVLPGIQIICKMVPTTMLICILGLSSEPETVSWTCHITLTLWCSLSLDCPSWPNPTGQTICSLQDPAESSSLPGSLQSIPDKVGFVPFCPEPC